MAKLSSGPATNPQDVLTVSTVQETDLGAKVESSDGRIFRYARVGTTVLVPATLIQAPAEVTNHQGRTPAAAAIGDTQVSVGLGATAADIDQYAGGYLVVTNINGAGGGYAYGVRSHAAVASSGTITVFLTEAVASAITASSTIDFVANPYNRVVINPVTTPTSAPIGVALGNPGASSYCWIQTHGPAIVQSEAAITVGASAAVGTTFAGTVRNAVGSESLTPIVGYALTGIAASEKGIIYLTID